MKTKAPLLLVMMLCIASCASRPLVYEEMTEQERQDEVQLQERLETSAESIAGIVFDFIDEEDQANLAETVIKALSSIQQILATGDIEQLTKDLIDRTIGDLKVLSVEVDDLAQDAFDLFYGWIDLPNINDILPEVVRDRLLAFVQGAITGLEPYVDS